MIEIYVNETLIDLPDETIDFGIDYAIFDVNNIGTQQGTRSYSLDLPFTDRNKLAFGSNDMLNNLSTLPYSKMPARIFVDGIDIKIRFCTLKSVKKNFSVEFYGGNSDFFYDIKDYKLTDLRLCGYSHYWDFRNIVDSRTKTRGYIYPLIAYTAPILINSVSCKTLLPSVFYEGLLEDICEELGFNLENEFELMPNLLLVSGGSDFKRDLNGEKYNGKIYAGSTYEIAESPPYYSDLLGYALLKLDTGESCSTFYEDNTHSDIGYGDKIEVTLEWNLTFRNPTVNDYFNELLIVSNYDVPGDTSTLIWNNTNVFQQIVNCPAGQDVTVSGTYTFITEDSVPTDFDNHISFFMGGLNFGGGFYFGLQIVEGSSVFFRNARIIEAGLIEYASGDYRTGFFPIGCAFQNITVKEIFSDYLKLTGKLLIQDFLNDKIVLIPFDKILENIGKAKDWTNKIELSEAEISFMNDEYGQLNWFKYKDESGEAKPINTDGFILIDNKNLQAEADLIEMTSSASATVVSSTFTTNQIMIYEDGEFKDKKNTRVLILDSVDSLPLGLDYEDTVTSENVTTDIPKTYFIKSGGEFNLGFGDSIIERNYEAISNVMQNYKVVSAPFRLTAADINQLDFTIPVFLSQYESYFYINKIQGYAPSSNESCIVELVKLNL